MGLLAIIVLWRGCCDWPENGWHLCRWVVRVQLTATEEISKEKRWRDTSASRWQHCNPNYTINTFTHKPKCMFLHVFWLLWLEDLKSCCSMFVDVKLLNRKPNPLVTLMKLYCICTSPSILWSFLGLNCWMLKNKRNSNPVSYTFFCHVCEHSYRVKRENTLAVLFFLWTPLF